MMLLLIVYGISCTNALENDKNLTLRQIQEKTIDVFATNIQKSTTDMANIADWKHQHVCAGNGGDHGWSGKAERVSGKDKISCAKWCQSQSNSGCCEWRTNKWCMFKDKGYLRKSLPHTDTWSFEGKGVVYSFVKEQNFDGTKAISAPSTYETTLDGDYTISAWVYATARTSDWARIIGKGSASKRNYGLWVSTGGAALSQSYCVSKGGNSWSDQNNQVALNQWTHIVGVFKKGGTHTLYVNGQVIKIVATSGNPCTSADPLTVGKASFHTGFIGKIKKAEVYNYAMKAELPSLVPDVQIVSEKHVCQSQLTNLGSFQSPGLCAVKVQNTPLCAQNVFAWSKENNDWGCRCCNSSDSNTYDKHDLWNVYKLTEGPKTPRPQENLRIVSAKHSCGKSIQNLGDFESASVCAAKVQNSKECVNNLFMWSQSYPVWGCHCCAANDTPDTFLPHDLWNVYEVAKDIPYGQNCNCGTRIEEWASGKNTVQLCRNACKSNKACKSFGLWTKESKSGGHCALFDQACTTQCPTPTNVAGGWFNDVYNRNEDEVSENNVKSWLEKLIAEGEKEISEINDAVRIATEVVADALKKEQDAIQKEGEAHAAMEDAKKILNTAKGVHEAAISEHAGAAPKLQAEIGVFKNVLSILDGLLGGKKLVEQDKVDIKSFISLDDQANPIKVQQVIDLVKGLQKVTEDELRNLVNAIAVAKDKLEKAEAEYLRTKGIWSAADAHLKRCELESDEVEGKLKTVTKYAGHRIPVVQDEIKTLREVIRLISSLL